MVVWCDLQPSTNPHTNLSTIHPIYKPCLPCLAVPSQNVKIAEISLSMLEALQRRFGSIGSLQAVDITYEYQRYVVGNVRGATCDPYRSILHQIHHLMEVTRTGGIKDRAKFFKGLCARIEPDGSWIDLEQYLQRSRFILENMAFFNYTSVEELDAAIIAMDDVFTRAGIVVVDRKSVV